ncbi:MAG: VOC family protein [Candidatus Promineifilaceae bacterium]|jgi:uncharacterized glyoxalase superfamily protein PhnB
MKAKQMNTVRHTHNFVAMVRFYRDTLGMEPVLSWEEPDNRGMLLTPGAAIENAVIELIELGQEAVPGVKPVNVVLTFEVEEVDAWHDELARAGVTIARGLEDAPWGHRSFGVDDPDGFRIWFYQDVSGAQAL